MSQVARWRRGTDDPLTARGWLFRFQDGPRTPEERQQRRLLFRLIGAYLVAALLLIAFVPAIGKLFPLFNLVIPVMGLTMRKFNEVSALEAGPGESFAGRMTVVDSQGVTTGLDQGWLIFSEGWLLFEGARTSFAVTRGEARGKLYGPQLNLLLEDRRTVLFSSLPDRHDAFHRAYADWNSASIPEGEALLPPKEIHPVIWADRWTLCIFGAVACGVVFGFGVGFKYWWVAEASAAVALACLWSAARYARRLRQEVDRIFVEPSEMHTMLRSDGTNHPAATVSDT